MERHFSIARRNETLKRLCQYVAEVGPFYLDRIEDIMMDSATFRHITQASEYLEERWRKQGLVGYYATGKHIRYDVPEVFRILEVRMDACEYLPQLRKGLPQDDS